jgi:hypothetical protein
LELKLWTFIFSSKYGAELLRFESDAQVSTLISLVKNGKLICSYEIKVVKICSIEKARVFKLYIALGTKYKSSPSR